MDKRMKRRKSEIEKREVRLFQSSEHKQYS